MRTGVISILILLFFFSSFTVRSQYKLKSLDLDENVTAWYDQEIGKNNAGIISGQYIGIKRVAKESHQFFETSEWAPSSLEFRGQVYDSIYMLYDVQTDVLSIRHPTNLLMHNQPIKLPYDQISWFRLHNHLFKNLAANSENNFSGFYDQLFEDENLSMLVKRKKILLLRQTVEFEENDFYYLEYQGQARRYWGKTTLFRLFKPYKSDLKKYIRKNDLDIKPESKYDGNLYIALSYLSSLMNAQ